jgi:hypothetical protein
LAGEPVISPVNVSLREWDCLGHRPTGQLPTMAQQKQTPEEIRAEIEKQEREERERVLAILDACMKSILAGYEPATLENADDHITTEQFTQSISEHVGELIHTHFIFSYLIENKYKFARTGSSTNLKWLLKRKSSS